MRVCKATKQNGEPCKAPPIKGLEVCRVHGGSAKRAKAKSKNITKAKEIQAAARRLGVPVDVDPKEGILGLISQKAGEVEWYRLQIASLSKDQDLIWGKTKAVSSDDGYSETYESSVNTWLILKNEAEKDLARYSEVALKYDIDERRIALAQESVSQVEAVIRYVLADSRLGLDPGKQALLPELMRDAVKTIVM